MRRFFAALTLIVGLVLLAYGTYLTYLRYRPLPAPAPVAAAESLPVTNSPTALTLPSLGLTLPVYPAAIEGNKWQTTSVGVSYLSTSPLPGEAGNSVLYGHNWPNLLGRLGELSPGDQVVVSFGGREVSYTVHYLSVVGPANSEIYANTSDSRLTIYTCTGFLDQERLVVTALLTQA